MDGFALEQVDSTATFVDDFVHEHVEDEQDDGEPQIPNNVQRLQHDQSILALAVNNQHIYAGTQGGEVLVRVQDHSMVTPLTDGRARSIHYARMSAWHSFKDIMEVSWLYPFLRTTICCSRVQLTAMSM